MLVFDESEWMEFKRIFYLHLNRKIEVRVFVVLPFEKFLIGKTLNFLSHESNLFLFLLSVLWGGL
jgi:hypothetical protein